MMIIRWSKMTTTDYDHRPMAHPIELTVSVEIKPGKSIYLSINQQNMMILLKHAAKWKYSNRNTVTTFSINSYYVISYTEDLDTNASLSLGMMLQCHTEDFPIHLMTDSCCCHTDDFRICNWLSLRRLVSWINHLPPACWSTFWKSTFKQQLGCSFDTMDSISSLFLYFDICNCICLDISYYFSALSLLLK